MREASEGPSGVVLLRPLLALSLFLLPGGRPVVGLTGRLANLIAMLGLPPVGRLASARLTGDASIGQEKAVLLGHVVPTLALTVLAEVVQTVVLLIRHGDQVGRSPARLRAAQVMDLVSIQDLPDEGRVGGDVGRDVGPTVRQADAPVVVPVASVTVDDRPVEDPAVTLVGGAVAEAVHDRAAYDALHLRRAPRALPPGIVHRAHLSSKVRTLAAFNFTGLHRMGA
jgi:hypothetical protein